MQVRRFSIARLSSKSKLSRLAVTEVPMVARQTLLSTQASRSAGHRASNSSTNPAGNNAEHPVNSGAER